MDGRTDVDAVAAFCREVVIGRSSASGLVWVGLGRAFPKKRGEADAAARPEGQSEAFRNRFKLKIPGRIKHEVQQIVG